MASVKKESDLYPTVSEWMESEAGPDCYKTWTNRGLGDVRPDVIGLRHAGGDLRGDFELITIEVKKSSKRFLTSAGQAGAYGVYADRTYLCCLQGDKPFDDEDIDIASHLGIGLLEIDGHKKVDRVLAAPVRQPIPRKRQELLRGLDWGVCQICGIPFPTSGFPQSGHSMDRKTVGGLVRGDTKNLSYAVKEKGNYIWWLWNWSKGLDRLNADDESSDSRYLCRDCVAMLFWELGPPEDDED